MKSASVLLALLVLSFNVMAHHSFISTYDPTRTMEVRGVVTKYTLRSPHTFIFIDVSTENGGVESLEIEMHSLPVLRRKGFDKDTFQPGDEITVMAWPNRNPANRLMFGIAVINADGILLKTEPDLSLAESLRDSQPAIRNTAGFEKLQGRWQAPIPEHFPESPLPLSPAGIEAWKNFDPQFSPANTCEPENIPGIFYAPYLTDIQLSPEKIVIHHESYNITRTVLFNSEPRLAESSGMLGMVSGRIEGDVLVIESSDFPESAWGLALAFDTNGSGADIPSSSQKKVVERYSVSSDGHTLKVEYTLEDPVYLTQAYTSFVLFSRVADDSPMYEFDCEIDSATRYSRDP